MRFAHVRGSQIVGITWQENSTPPAGCIVLPIVTEPKPVIDTTTQELDSFYQVSPDRKFVACLYIVQDKAPEPERPPGSTVIVQQVSQPVDTSAIDAQVAALQAAVAEMQAAQAETQAAARIGDLIGTVMNGKDDAAEAAATALIPFATERGMTVPEFVLWWVSRDNIKGAA